MTESPQKNCPQCKEELVAISSGKLICRACGWTNYKKKLPASTTTSSTELKEQQTDKIALQTELNKQVENYRANLKGIYSSGSLISAGKVFLTVGLLMMIAVLMGYETTVCKKEEYYSSCTHNIGLLNEKSNLVNFGGFLFIGGCVLMTLDRKKDS